MAANSELERLISSLQDLSTNEDIENSFNKLIVDPSKITEVVIHPYISHNIISSPEINNFKLKLNEIRELDDRTIRNEKTLLLTEEVFEYAQANFGNYLPATNDEKPIDNFAFRTRSAAKKLEDNTKYLKNTTTLKEFIIRHNTSQSIPVFIDNFLTFLENLNTLPENEKTYYLLFFPPRPEDTNTCVGGVISSLFEVLKLISAKKFFILDAHEQFLNNKIKVISAYNFVGLEVHYKRSLDYILGIPKKLLIKQDIYALLPFYNVFIDTMFSILNSYTKDIKTFIINNLVSQLINKIQKIGFDESNPQPILNMMIKDFGFDKNITLNKVFDYDELEIDDNFFYKFRVSNVKLKIIINEFLFELIGQVHQRPTPLTEEKFNLIEPTNLLNTIIKKIESNNPADKWLGWNAFLIMLEKKEASKQIIELMLLFADKNSLTNITLKEVLELIIEKHGSEIIRQYPPKMLALDMALYSCLDNKHDELAIKLVDLYGDKLNEPDKDGNNPFLLAVKKNIIKLASYILKVSKNLDINYANNDGNTALMLAAINSNIKIIEKLIFVPEIDILKKNNDMKNVIDLSTSFSIKKLIYQILRSHYASNIGMFKMPRKKIKTGRNLDLAIHGDGFFVLKKNDKFEYSRIGEFSIDKDGNLTDYFGRKVMGFPLDEYGNAINIAKELRIIEDSHPQQTSTFKATLNLDSTAIPPAQDFVPGFVPGNEPALTTFNNTVSVQIFDSLGNSHILTTYYVKAPAERTWQVFIGIDGTDVTPSAATVPVGGTPAAPIDYPIGSIAAPFTLVFDCSGNLVKNITAAPTKHFGNPPVISADTTTTLANSGSLETIDVGDLLINGVPIVVNTVTDILSTTDNSAGIITIIDTINKDYNRHKVVATRNDTILDMPAAVNFTAATGVLAAGDFTVNGTQVTGDIAAQAGATELDQLVSLINSIGGTGISGITASNSAGSLRLTATDSRNIQVATDGTTGSGLDFANLSLTGGEFLNRVKRGSFSLEAYNNRGITIGGNNPSVVGLEAGTQAGIFQNNSDVLQVTYNPGTGATSPETVTIDLASSTQFACPFSITSLKQDGLQAGNLVNIDIDREGFINILYDNGQSVKAGQIALAKIPDLRWIQEVDNYAYKTTHKSGDAIPCSPGTGTIGIIESGALEDIKNIQPIYQPMYSGKIRTFKDEQMEQKSEQKLRKNKLLTRSY